jgi:hypothetical protein
VRSGDRRGREEVGVIDDVIAWLNERWPEMHCRRPLLTSGIAAGLYRNSAKVVLILFDERGTAGAVVKAARRRSAEASLEAEYQALDRFARLGCRSVVRDAPKPLALGHVRGHLVLALSPVPGTPMTAKYYSAGHTSNPRRVARDFAAAGRWLAGFQQETMRGHVTLDAKSMPALVADVIDRYREQIGWSAEEDRFFRAVVRRAVALRGTAIPIVGVHGDYWMGNLLVSGGEVQSVVDWELARVTGLPFSDVFKFTTSYGLYLDRAYPGGNGSVPGHPGWTSAREKWRAYGDWANLTGFGYSYFGRGWFPTLVRRYIEQHLAVLGIPPQLNSVFFPLFLAEQAMTLDDPVFRDGYRSALIGLSNEMEGTWLCRLNGFGTTTRSSTSSPRPRGRASARVAPDGS